MLGPILLGALLQSMGLPPVTWKERNHPDMPLLGTTSSTAIAQNGPPPLQTEQQATLTYVGNITYVGRSEGWTPLTFERF
jgi:hypothetical protein